MLSNARRMPGRRRPTKSPTNGGGGLISPRSSNVGGSNSLALPSTVLGFFLIVWLCIGLLFHFGFLASTANLRGTANKIDTATNDVYVPPHVAPRDHINNDEHHFAADVPDHVAFDEPKERTAAPLKQLDAAEMRLLKTYTQSEAVSVRRLKQSGTVKWGNGHDNRIWLMQLQAMDKEVIFKLNDLDMLFTDPSGRYDPIVSTYHSIHTITLIIY
jgi:hypothetical protein